MPVQQMMQQKYERNLISAWRAFAGWRRAGQRWLQYMAAHFVIMQELTVPSCVLVGARLWRAAVMAAIQRQRPHDKEAWALAHHHFGCARETAASLQADAQVAPMPCGSPC